MKPEEMEIIKESNTTYLLNFLIHGKARNEIKKEIKKELISRGALLNIK